MSLDQTRLLRLPLFKFTMLLRFVTRACSPLCSNALAANRLAQVAPKSYFPRSVLRSRLETPCEVRQITTGIRPSFANTLHGPTKSPLLFKARNLKFTIACATTGLALALSVDTIHCDGTCFFSPSGVLLNQLLQQLLQARARTQSQQKPNNLLLYQQMGFPNHP